MEKEVWLTIIGEQTDEDGNREKNGSQCKASYEYSGDAHHLIYREVNEDDGAATDAELLIMDERVVVRRSGEVSSTMNFQAGKTTGCRYSTPFGVIPMKIHTRRIALQKTAKLVHVRIFYELEMEGVGLRKSALIIKIEPMK